MSWWFIFSVITALLCLGAFFVTRPGKEDSDKQKQNAKEARIVLCGATAALSVLFMVLASFAIIKTGSAGVVRTFGVVQQESLGEGLQPVMPPWATVTRVEHRGFQLAMSGEQKLEVITLQGARFHMDASIPLKLNPAAAAMIESRIEGGDWKSEVSSLTRGLIRTNVASYATFADFNARRSAVPGQEIIVREATDTEAAIVRSWDVAYGEELAGQIEDRINGLFCDTYQICGLEAVDVGELVIRKVTPPAAVTAEAAALDAAQLAKQTELALNEVEEIRAQRRAQEGTGYGNLFAFLPDGAELSAADAADFLRASATKTEADANAYMQRQLAESISGAMEEGKPLPSLIISTGGQGTPQPMFNALPTVSE